MEAAPCILPLGDTALVLEFGTTIDPAVNRQVHAAAARLRGRALPGVRDLVPAYASLTVHYDPLQWTTESLGPRLLQHLQESQQEGSTDDTNSESAEHIIPVCYGGDYGPDLDDVAAELGLSKEQIISRHTAVSYPVYFLGFAPGFPYLGGLDESLAVPRLESPRTRVPSGSVGLAGEQTGVYPQDSPGGWRIIGRTPLELFDPNSEVPCRIQAGDRVRFCAITPSEFKQAATS